MTEMRGQTHGFLVAVRARPNAAAGNNPSINFTQPWDARGVGVCLHDYVSVIIVLVCDYTTICGCLLCGFEVVCGCVLVPRSVIVAGVFWCASVLVCMLLFVSLCPSA